MYVVVSLIHSVHVPSPLCKSSHTHHINRGLTDNDVYLWDVEHLGKYFPSEGEGIENNMAALTRDKSGDKVTDEDLARRAQYNKLIGEHECILANIRRKPGGNEEVRAYVRAGPVEKLHFNPKNVNAAIVTCGGLCPGLNNVIR